MACPYPASLNFHQPYSDHVFVRKAILNRIQAYVVSLYGVGGGFSQYNTKMSHYSVSEKFPTSQIHVIGPFSHSEAMKHNMQLMQEHAFCILGDLGFSLLSQKAAFPFYLPKSAVGKRTFIILSHLYYFLLSLLSAGRKT